MPVRFLLISTIALTSCSSARHGTTTPGHQNRTPEQLTEYLRTHSRAIAAGDANVLATLDALCGQHDCRTSRLFWFTDLEAAEAKARRENKPILSLRLLGKLTDPQSCANSRFFRDVLYPDPAINELLRERFVLHWKEVRAVPKVTIDFGDGRTMKRTLTGNSAHYVLDAEGRPLDVIPGLVSPRAFADMLAHDIELVAQLAAAGPTRDAQLATWHASRLDALVAAWRRLLRERGIGATPKRGRHPEDAVSMLDATTRGFGYARLATSAKLAPDVERRISSRFPDAWRANDRAVTKAILESPVLRGLRQISDNIGRDSIENELWQRGRIHGWFLRGQIIQGDAIALDHRVYAELFLAPLDDPWYGLMPSEEMRALDDCAVALPKQ